MKGSRLFGNSAVWNVSLKSRGKDVRSRQNMRATYHVSLGAWFCSINHACNATRRNPTRAGCGVQEGALEGKTARTKPTWGLNRGPGSPDRGPEPGKRDERSQPRSDLAGCAQCSDASRRSAANHGCIHPRAVCSHLHEWRLWAWSMGDWIPVSRWVHSSNRSRPAGVRVPVDHRRKADPISHPRLPGSYDAEWWCLRVP